MTDRRTFLHHLGASSTLAFLPAVTIDRFESSIDKRDTTIDAVEVIKVTGPYQSRPGYNRQFQVQAVHIYDDQRPKEYKDQPDAKVVEGNTSQYFICIKTKGGLEGFYGAIDSETVAPIIQQMADFLKGKNALDVEMLWDQLYKRNRHGRAGHYMMAISAIDNALWDLRGKYFDVPVYQLLGGATRKEIQVYGSCLGFTAEPGKIGPKVKELYDKGFVHQKWFAAHGPGEGVPGLNKAVNMVREIREGGGDNLQFMIDSYMGWDLPFAIAWAKEVEKYHPYWIEEAFPVDRLIAFETLSKSTSIPIATGEHFYSRWEVVNFLRAGVQIIQADPEWCGGISELVKICHLASAFGAKVFPHGHNLPAQMHVVASQSPEVCPLVEYLINHVEHKVHFFKEKPLTDNGKIALPTSPGLSVALDNDVVEKKEVVRF